MSNLLRALIWPSLIIFNFLFSSAFAAQKALLVGVSEYPVESVGDLQLKGPKFDVALMLKTLRDSGFSDGDITVLADHFEESGERAANGAPTKAAIMSELDKLANAAKSGDQIVIYLSGHGSQSPITQPSSLLYHPDGLNPIFLPIDIGKWSDEIGKVENAIAGDEFGAALTAIRKKGAFVFVVIDACHSGTITRSAEQGMIAKKVEPASLGIPQQRLEAAAKMATDARAQTRGGNADAVTKAKRPVSVLGLQPVADGGYVAFFAAHPDELALQRNLPKGYGAGDRRPQGVLTFYLVQALRSGHAQSYLDLARMVMAGYEQWGASAPTPLFEGDLHNDILGAKANAPHDWLAHVDKGQIKIDAGVLDDISVGTILSLRHSAGTDVQTQPLGFGRVVAVSPSSSILEPMAHGTQAVLDVMSLDNTASLVAKIEERGMSLEFIVALPIPNSSPTQDETVAFDAVQMMASNPEAAPANIRFVPATEAADIHLSIQNQRIWFSGDDGQLVISGRGKSSSIPLAGLTDPSKMKSAIETVLKRQFKVRNLIRAAETMGGGDAAKSLEIKAALLQSDVPSEPAAGVPSDDRDCKMPGFDKIPQAAQAFDMQSGLPNLFHCDVIYFSVRNIGKNPIDVTPLYIDGGGSIGYMGPVEGLRLQPGAQGRIIPITIVTYDHRQKMPFPIGLERLLFIAVEQETKAALPADFRYLAQPALAQSSSTRGGSNALKSWLETAAFGSARTRSASVGASVGNAGIVQYRWKVNAPE